MSCPFVEAICTRCSSSTRVTPTTPKRSSTVSADTSPDSRLYTFKEIIHTTPPGFTSSRQADFPNTLPARPQTPTSTTSSTILSTIASMKSKNPYKKSKKSKSKGKKGAETPFPVMTPLASASTAAGTTYTPIVIPDSATPAGSSTQVNFDPKNIAAYLAYKFGGMGNSGGSGSGIPEPSGPEYGFPGFGLLPNISPEAQAWYRSVRVVISYGVDDMNFADGKYKGIITATYPLRDSINKIMWDETLDLDEGASLARFGRIYARTQGDSRDGVSINKAYLRITGLEGLNQCLVNIFKNEAARRARKTLPAPEVIQAVSETIARLELQGAGDDGEKQFAEGKGKKMET